MNHDPTRREPDTDWESVLASVDALCGDDAPEPAPRKATSQPRAGRNPVKKRKKKRSPLPVIAGIAAVGALLIALTILVLPRFLTAAESRFPENTTICGIDLGGKTRSEAESALLTLTAQPLTIRLGPASTLTLDPAALQIRLDMDSLLAQASQSPAALSLTPYLTYDADALHNWIGTQADRLSSTTLEPEYGYTGPLPDLSTDTFTPGTALPAVTISPGADGVSLNTALLEERITQALSGTSREVAASDLVTPVAAGKLSAQAVLDALTRAPVSDALDPATGNITVGSYGITLDESALEAALAGGQSVTLPLTAVAPEVLGQEVYFQDVLGYSMSPHSQNEARNTNLAIACAALNGVVLQPGQTLSYNDTVGERTEAADFQPAPAYSGTDLVPSIGGGVCQVSSTLYLCSLFAELETVERVNHGLPVSYLPLGLDATVSYGTVDLKFTNPYDYPIKIIAETDEGFVRTWIMGTETRDYFIKMRYTAGGTYAVARYVHYDRETGECLDTEEDIRSRDPIRSGYLDEVMSIQGQIGSGDAYINTNIRPQEILTPSDEILAESMNYKVPNSRAK